MKRLLLAALAMSAATEAAASCGSAFCMINTNWNTQGQWTEPGARFDLRFEYIDQDQPMAGSRKVGVGEIPQHHDEVRTLNRNWIGTFDYTFNQDWGLSATLPIVDKFHTHIHNHMGEQIAETWNFTEVGDARVLGRRQWHAESAGAQRLDFYGINFGLKLPTGKTDVTNSEGELAERTLQPGTGTTDLLLGGYFSRVLGSGSTWFADLLVQAPLDSRQLQAGDAHIARPGLPEEPGRQARPDAAAQLPAQGARQRQRCRAGRQRRQVPVPEPRGELHADAAPAGLWIRPVAALPVRERRAAHGRLGGRGGPQPAVLAFRRRR